MTRRIKTTEGAVLVLLVALLRLPSAVAEGDDCDHYSAPPGGSCEDTDYTSRCWASGQHIASAAPFGFPLNINLWQCFGPADLPPRKTNPILSSIPLVPADAFRNNGPNPYPQRAMHHDVIDLVTGEPLLQEIDFELPFGGAVFRHVRTYSENFADSPFPEADQTQLPDGASWDWNGLNWAMSENPILLIDGEFPLIDFPGFPIQPPPAATRRCYFIPDSHHAIPFIFDPDQNEYKSPPQFDATLRRSEDGSTFFLWLQRQSIKYTIRAHYEDLWTIEGSSVNVHSPRLPNGQGGYGYPYYGLVEKIEDRYGNTVEYKYCPTSQTTCDDPVTPDCTECCQNCNEKGQLTSIKLRAGNGNVVWTLLYTHRGFRTYAHGSYQTELMSHHALHSIHVYKGDVDAPASCLTIPENTFPMPQTIADLYALDLIDHPLIPSGWLLRVKYFYASSNHWTFTGGLLPNYAPSSSLWDDYHLLKATVTRRFEGQSEISAPQISTLYRYAYFDASGGPHSKGATQLTSVIYQPTLGRIVKALQEKRLDPSLGTNSVLEMDDSDEIELRDEHTGETTTLPLQELVDLRFKDRDYHDAYSWAHSHYPGPTDPPYVQALKIQFADFPERTVFNHVGKGVFSDRRSGRSDNGCFQFFHFYVYPSTTSISNPTFPASGFIWNQTSMYHYPYRFPLPDSPSTTGLPNMSDASHIVVVEELKPDARHVCESRCNCESTIPDCLQCPRELKSRRVVRLNAAGAILGDETWSYERNPEGQLVDTAGVIETNRCDEKGRVIERRTSGWNSAENGDRNTNGLIHVYEYEADRPDGRPGELHAEGIKRGTNGPVYYTRRLEHGNQSRPDLVTAEVQFPTPQTDLNGPGNVTTTFYDLAQVGDGYSTTWREKSRAVIQPGTAQARDGATAYALEQTCYDANGNTTFVGVGSISSPSNLTSKLDYYVTYNEYDECRNLIRNIVDADPALLPNWPAGFERVSSRPALHLQTTRTYENPGSFLRSVVYPNGREELHLYLGHLNTDHQLWVYKDLLRVGNTLRLLSPLEISFYESGQLARVERARMQTVDDTEYQVISTSTPTYDAHGRMIGMQIVGAAATDPIAAQISYDPYGHVDRQVDPDGSITRNVYDALGRLEKVYRGTADTHSYWETADPDHPENFSDDMLLTEKRYYGTGVSNAGELASIRHYRDRPDNQYSQGCPDCDPPIPDSSEDQTGWVVLNGYDWRMRQVWVEHQDGNGNPIQHTLTWLDNLDRPKLVIEYGATFPELADPRNMDSTGTIPTPAAILGTTPKPISLTENIYNTRGQVEEERHYKTATTDPLSFTATVRYYDFRGHPLEVIAPNTPRHQYAYDGKGREIASKAVAPDGSVLTQTDTFYDPDDRAIRIITSERVRTSAPSFVPNASNLINRYTHQWFDLAGRLIAAADYGTAAGSYSNAAEPDRNSEPPVHLGEFYDVLSPDRSRLNAPALLTVYSYDKNGRQTAVFHSSGAVTRTEYDGLGRTLLTLENADDLDPLHRRATAYAYDSLGRLSKIAAVFPTSQGGVTHYSDINWAAADGHLQVTELAYGANVVTGAGDAQSSNRAAVAEVHFPDRQTGQPTNEDNYLHFTYYADGSIASRQDSNANTMTFHYDELGRPIELLVDDQWFYPPASPGDPPIPDRSPPGRIHRIVYSYEPDGNLAMATAYSLRNGSDEIISETKFEYDDLRHLKTEWQAHRDSVSNESPRVDYTWSYSPMSSYNFDRLAALVYPKRGLAGRRTVSLTYGNNADDLNSTAGVITRIDDSYRGMIATFEYAGQRRRTSASYGNGVHQSFGDGVSGYSGLDPWGRIVDLHYQDGSGETLHRYQYGYDDAACGCAASGNRLFSRVTQQPVQGVPHENDRSWRFGYDALERLVSATMGRLATDNSQIESGSGAPIPLDTTWALDNLGNWSGGANDRSVIQTGDFANNGTVQERSVHHSVNAANEIMAVVTNGTQATFPHVDLNGNLVADAQYVYQYDAWNRLMQVNQRGGATFDYAGRIANGQVGPLVVRFVYDGLGRLMRKELPIGLGDDALQVEDYYYDGVRRIQERITQPASIPIAGASTAGGEGEGEGEIVAVLNQYLLQVQLEEGLPPDPDAGGQGPVELLVQGINPIPPPQPSPSDHNWTEREYIWGPQYVDECLAQFDKEGRPIYVLQDANDNVVGLVSGGGTDAPASGTLLEQYTYEPYGGLVAAESFAPHAVNRLGHQGLFFDHFDAGPDGRVLLPNAPGLYFNRNRHYSPTFGRFLQRDPNETGLPLLTAMAMNGEVWSILFNAFGAKGLYGDGMNLYAYAGSNPVSRNDSSGLDFTIAGILSNLGIIEGFDAVDWQKLVLGIKVTGSIAQTAAIFELARIAAIEDLFPTGSGDDCQHKYTWCKWAVRNGHRKPGRGWPRNMSYAACSRCYSTCKVTGTWPKVGPCRFPDGDQIKPEVWPDD